MVIEELKEENKKEKPVLPYEKDGDVIILTDDNFEEVVMSN